MMRRALLLLILWCGLAQAGERCAISWSAI